MPRFRIEDSVFKNDNITINGSDYNHMVNVLRLREHDEVTLFTDDREYRAIIIKVTDNYISLEIVKTFEINRESELLINLFQGMIKTNKMELIIQKCTELGVKTFTPVINARSQIKHTNKIRRWERIADEACKQCGRNMPVIINQPLHFSDLPIKKDEKVLNISFDIESDTDLKSYITDLVENPKVVNLFVGPEGGFNSIEKKVFTENNVRMLRLGPRVMRSETASLTSISIIQYLLGDL